MDSDRKPPGRGRARGFIKPSDAQKLMGGRWEPGLWDSCDDSYHASTNSGDSQYSVCSSQPGGRPRCELERSRLTRAEPLNGQHADLVSKSKALSVKDLPNEDEDETHQAAYWETPDLKPVSSVLKPVAFKTRGEPMNREAARALSNSTAEPVQFEALHDVDPPVNFPGRLIAGEKWAACPYFKGHKYISNRDAYHLTNCRAVYTTMKQLLGKPMDIGICTYSSEHHVHVIYLKRHELECAFQSSCFAYLAQRAEKLRMSKQKESESKDQSKEKKDGKEQSKQKMK